MLLSLWLWRCRWGRHALGGLRSALGRATHVDADAVAAGHFLIHSLQNNGTAIERNDFTILRTAGRARRTNVVLAAWAALKMQLLQLGAVGEIHHDAAVRPAVDNHRLTTLAACGGLRPRQIFVTVIGAIAPAADDLFGPNRGRHFRDDRRRHGLRGGRWLIGGAVAERQATYGGRSRKQAYIAQPRRHDSSPRPAFGAVAFRPR